MSSIINSVELSILLPTLFRREGIARDLIIGSWNLFTKGLSLGFIGIMCLLPDLRDLDSTGGTQYPGGASEHLSHMPYMEPFDKSFG